MQEDQPTGARDVSAGKDHFPYISSHFPFIIYFVCFV